jgi:lipoate-protein ligase A
MTQAATQSKANGIEYSVYTFLKGTGNKKQRNKWKKHAVKAERGDALNTAERLYKSGKYKKVEVKQKYFDDKNDRMIDITLKVLEEDGKANINIFAILTFAALCGAAAFSITYYIYS